MTSATLVSRYLLSVKGASLKAKARGLGYFFTVNRMYSCESCVTSPQSDNRSAAANETKTKLEMMFET